MTRQSAKETALHAVHTWWLRERFTTLKNRQRPWSHSYAEDMLMEADRMSREYHRRFEIKMWLVDTFAKMFLFTFISWMLQAVEQHSGKGHVNWLIVGGVCGATAFWQFYKGFKKFVP